MNNKISIITINYNNFEGLKRTLESVINQTWKEFEYIVIDGGSTDGSAEYIESKSSKIDYWISEPDTGIYNAMNKGIAQATGEYLLFLNSGDHLYDNLSLENCRKFLLDKDIVYFNLNVVDSKSSFIKEYPEKLIFSYFVKDSLPHPATFIKRTLFNEAGLYNEYLLITSDWKFFMDSICIYNASYLKVDKVLSTFYLDGVSSQLLNKDIIAKEKRNILESNYKGFIDDDKELNELKKIISNLRKSKKIQLLIKLGLLNKF